MNWLTITRADLYNSKVAALIDAADTASLGDGQRDRTTGIIADVTLEVRRRVARANALDADTTTIPGGLKPLAVDIIYCRLKMALEMELTKDESDCLARRSQELDRIADGKEMIDPPDHPIAANYTQAEPHPSFGRAPHREFSHRHV